MLEQNNKQFRVGMEVVSLERVCDHLSGSYGINRTEAEKIMATYAESLQETLQTLQNALITHDREEGSYQAHALKGVFLNLGLTGQADVAAILERELRKEILDRHKIQLECLIDELQPII